jgi:hypothetical protein
MHIRHLLQYCLISATLLLSPALLTFSTPAQASPRLQAHPIKLLGYKGDDLRIAVELPCGTELYGLIASADDKGRLFLAAAALQPEILCTSLPEEQEILVPYIATSGFQSIAPLDTDGLLNRLSLVPVSEVLTAKRKHGGKLVRAVYETRCGTPVGTLIRQTSATDLDVAMVELKDRPSGMASAAVQTCDYGQRSKPIPAIALGEGYNVRPLAKDVTDVGHVSYLRLAPVAAGELKAAAATAPLPARPLVVRYFRRCNEAPVGLVVGSRTRRAVQVGVLVARYLNHRCVEGDHGEWAALTATDLVLSDGKTPLKLTAMAPSAELDSLRLKAPFELDKAPGAGRAARLMIDYFKTCERTLGAVYARDPAGRLAVGVLTRAAAAASSECKTAATRVSFKVSMMHPFLSRHVRAGDLYPMRLKGL